MFSMIIEGFCSVLNLQSIFVMFAGTFIGIIFGAIPGLNTAMAVALCLPITYTLTATNGVAMIMGLFIGGVSGGLIAAILLNIPGTPASLATTFDGHPMALKGQAGRAMGVGLFYSFVGGLIGMVALLTLSPILARFALKFTPVEYFAVAVFSLTMMASLSGKSLIKGLITGCFGMYIAMFGRAPIDFSPRFTFGFMSLEAGFGMVSVLTGSFAVSEVLRSAKASVQVTGSNVEFVRIKGFGFTVREFFGQFVNMIRSAVIGIGIGVLPGVGAGTSNLIAYTMLRTHPNIRRSSARALLMVSLHRKPPTMQLSVVPSCLCSPLAFRVIWEQPCFLVH